MRVRVLGSGAGGGFPQWNCGCPTCRAVREGTRPCRPRTQSSIAVSASGERSDGGNPGDGKDPGERSDGGEDGRWFLVNASPDVRAQIEACAALHPREDRDTPIAGVLLTDAEIDHTLGLLLLREGRGVTVHATTATHETLRTGTSVLSTLERYCPVDRRVVRPGVEVTLGEGLSYRAFDVPTTKAARFDGVDDDTGRVVGYRFTDTASGRFLVYLPGVQRLTDAVRAEIAGAEVLLLDGTCWHDDEMKRLGLADKSAHDMGHLAVGDPGGSLSQVAGLGVGRTIYVHINNTNPMLIEDSPEAREVAAHGAEVGVDGLEVRV